MKTSSRWTLVIGIAIVALALIGQAFDLVQPSDIRIVDVAGALNSLMWIIFGGYLIYLYVQARNGLSSEVAALPAAGSPEDRERLRIRRNWIIAILLVVSFVISADSWIVNNYFAGATLANIEVIFDLIFNLGFLWIAVELFRGKRDVTKVLLYAIIVYSAVEGVLEYMRGFPFLGLAVLIPLAYFVFALTAPINRRNHMIAQVVLLPLVIILSLAVTELDNLKLTGMVKAETLLENQYSDDTDNINNLYSRFLQSDSPSRVDMQNILTAIDKRDAKYQEILTSLGNIRAEYEKQLPATDQLKNIEHTDDFLAVLAAQQAQTDKAKEVMQYAEQLNFAYLSDAQMQKLSDLESQIVALGDPITQAQFKMDNEH